MPISINYKKYYIMIHHISNLYYKAVFFILLSSCSLIVCIYVYAFIYVFYFYILNVYPPYPAKFLLVLVTYL